MTTLLNLKAPKPRFARSINVERDAGTSAIDGYLPVGRAIDAISRIALALNHDDVEVAFSVTGPYGSGKSSLAVMLDALVGPARDPARASAEELLEHAAPAALDAIRSARRRLRADDRGFIRAVATSQREPISATVVRALMSGAERYQPSTKQRAAHGRVMQQLAELHEGITSGLNARPETRVIRSVVADLGQLAPVLLLIDEFGKNLEAFADSRSDADLFLLQELAEWTRGGDGLPLALVTMQHMAFDEYADTASASQRREWAKIQGRFEDIPFVDSPRQTRALIAAAFGDAKDQLAPALDRWAALEQKTLAANGLTDLAADPVLLAACWPLHPLSLAVLPDLCERYGQNERTLFSFLAGPEPRAVPAFLSERRWSARSKLPSVRLHQLYDYFIESASTMVGVSSAASRWLEIDTRIRDAHGLRPGQLRVLKAIGLLNLVSAGGSLRASREVIIHAAADGDVETSNAADVLERLGELEGLGLVTYRDFADEFRVWQGSDMDLRSALEVARRRVRDLSPADLLACVLPLSPIVAARHSHETGTLRAFARAWIDPDVSSIDPLGIGDRPDGTALYVLGADAPTGAITVRQDAKPIAFLTTDDPTALVAAAIEMAAIDELLESSDDVGDDWVARRELIERRVEARAALDHEFERAYGALSASRGDWKYAKSLKPRSQWMTLTTVSASQALSAVADVWYAKAPRIHNDLANRHDLSSQAAKARRILVEAMVSGAESDALGITGNGPDHTMYLSLLRETDLHGFDGVGWGFTEPTSKSPVAAVWTYLTELLRDAVDGRTRVDDIYGLLSLPPYGVREGIAPVLLVSALLVHAEEVALYEHGTFRAVLSGDVLERLLRNPGNFEVKHFANRTGSRAEYLAAAAHALGVEAGGRNTTRRVGSVLAVLTRLVSQINTLPDHVKRTTYLSESTRAVRSALLLATEPDELLFRAVPGAFGKKPVPARGKYSRGDIGAIAEGLREATSELAAAYPTLLGDVRKALLEELRGPSEGLRENLAVRARDLQGKVIDPRVARLLVALAADIPGDDEWAEYVAMNVTGTPPAAWTDDDRRRFFTTLHDVGSTFRRLEALSADLRSRDDGFDALRVTVTRSDGQESARVVWVDEARRAALGDLTEELVHRASKMVGSEAEARDLLLGLLASADVQVTTGIEGTVAGRAYSESERDGGAAEA